MIFRLLSRYYFRLIKYVFLLTGFLSISIANDCAEGQVLIEESCYSQNDIEVLVDFAENSEMPNIYANILNIGNQNWDEDGRLISWVTNYNLSGEIPESIGNLTSLTTLILSNMNFSGTIPNSIGNLTNLVTLDLSNNELSGTIPDSIGNLTSLTTLILANMNFSGTIPNSIGSLVNLTTLSLSKNELSGQIPNSIGNLTSLESLYLDYNQLSSEIPAIFENLTNLITLDLSNNELSGTIPDAIGNLTNLESLYLDYNQLSGNIPESLVSLINLQVLDLRSNILSGEIPQSFGSFPNLYSLYLGYNQLSGEIPQSIGSLVNITTLQLNDNELSGEIPESICEIPVFSQTYSNNVQLYNNNLCPPFPECVYGQQGYQDMADCDYQTECDEGYIEILGSCHYMSDLDVLVSFAENSDLLSDYENVIYNMGIQSWNLNGRLTYWYNFSTSLSGQIPESIGNLTSLTTLLLYSTSLSGQIPESIGNLINLERLSLWNWGSNNINGELPESIGELINLKELSLYNTKLSGQIPEIIGNLINLEHLTLFDNEFSGTIPNVFGNLTNLILLNLDNNELSGQIPESIGNLTNLLSLALDKNNLGCYDYNIEGNACITHCDDTDECSGQIPEIIGNLTSLEWLQLNHNYLSGQIPDAIGNLTNLERLELYDNELSGTIPDAIGNLINLERLNLNDNEFSGTIPSVFENLTNLKILDLDNNELSGQIPESIGSLTNLEILYLRENQLSGQIPESIGSLTNLETLKLDVNHLGCNDFNVVEDMCIEHCDDTDECSGQIPESIGNLTSLEKLYLSDNYISGQIPESIGNLTNLNTLYLDENQLSDEIPESICELDIYFQSTMFRNNNLCPPYPSCLDNVIDMDEQDLSSCLFGCMDDGQQDWSPYPETSACNYDEQATWDDGSCAYFDLCGVCGDYSCTGCMDQEAFNYDPDATATYEGSCDYFQLGTITTPNILYDNTRGAIWGDYDNDGLSDLLLLSYGAYGLNNTLYKNNGNWNFTEAHQFNYVSSESGSWIDYNNDGNLDVFFSGPNFIMENDGNGSFSDIIMIGEQHHSSFDPVWGDFDNDGDLDHFITSSYANFLSINNGDGGFTIFSRFDIVIPDNPVINPKASSLADIDNDGHLDLLLLQDGKNILLHNNDGNGTFTEIVEGVILDGEGNSVSSSWGDYDNNGFLDLFVINIDQNNALYKNTGGVFEKIEGSVIVSNYDNMLEDCHSSSSSWGDYDNDGHLDLFVANQCGGNQSEDGSNNFLYHNDGNGGFTEIVEGDVVTEVGNSNSATWGDYNNDGFLDLFVTNYLEENSFLYKNYGNDNHWINIKLDGGGINPSAIGARVKVKANINGTNTWQMREIFSQTGKSSQNSLNAEFGLGNAEVIDSIIVKWPSGGEELIMINVAVDQFLTIEDTRIPGCMDPNACNYNLDAQGNDGSCQYLDGCGECLGASTFNQYLDCNSICYGGEGYIGQFLPEDDPLYDSLLTPNNGVDFCEVCGGDNTTCAGSLSLQNLTPNENSNEGNSFLVDVYVENAVGISGFQYDITGAYIINVSSRFEEENPSVSITNSEVTVVGWCLCDEMVPAGGTVLTQMEIIVNDHVDSICLNDIVLSQSGGQSMYIEENTPCITFGCTDPSACNYNEDADYSLGFCEYPEEYFNCNGDCISGLDINGECCSEEEKDLCDDCFGENNCPAVRLSISNINNESKILDLFLESTIEIAGFQLSLLGIQGIDNGVSGGITGDLNFVQSSHYNADHGTTIILFSMLGVRVPDTTGVLAQLEFSNYLDEVFPSICFEGIVLSNSDGEQVDEDDLVNDVEQDDCYRPGCTDMQNCSYDEGTNIDDGSCISDLTAVGGSENGLDCAGICSGSTILDDCDNCGGDCFGLPGAECGNYDCDGNCAVIADGCDICGGPNIDCDAGYNEDSCPDMDYCGVCFGNNDCVPKLLSYAPGDSLIDIHTEFIDFYFSLPVNIDVNGAIIILSDKEGAQVPFVEWPNTQDHSNIRIKLDDPLIANDILTIVLDACKITSFPNENGEYGDYCLDGNLNGIPEIEGTEADTSITMQIALLGDYDYDHDVDQYDLDTLIQFWTTDDFTYKLGPYLGEVPFLQLNSFDLESDYNLDDLMAFIQMWNWSFENSIAREIVHNPTLNFIPKYSFEKDLLKIDLAQFPGNIKRILLRSDLSGTNMAIDNAAQIGQYDILLQGSYTEGHIHEWVMGSFTSIENQTIGLFKVHTSSRDDQLFTVEYEIIGSNQESASGEIQIIYHPIPNEFSIGKPYPNPFNPVTDIEYALPEKSNLSIGIYDIRGRILQQDNNTLEPGYYTFTWDASAYSSGIYFIQFQASDIVQTHRVLLLK